MMDIEGGRRGEETRLRRGENACMHVYFKFDIVEDGV